MVAPFGGAVVPLSAFRIGQATRSLWLLSLLIGHACAGFFQLTDLHFDNLYNQQKHDSNPCRNRDDSHGPYGTYACDPPLLLWNSALEAMKLLDPNPDFILYTGDFGAHQSPSESDTYDAVRDAVGALKQAFDAVPFYPTIGNDDMFPSYYMPLGNASWLERLADAYQLGWMDADQRATFERGGYYAVQISPSTQLIVLNIDYLCISHTPDTHSLPDPDAQFSWFEAQLAAARAGGRKVLIQGHMPPGAGRGGTQNMWDQYEQTLVGLLSNFSDVVVCAMMGHSHRETFRLVYNETQDPAAFILLTGALSPIDNNNPTFRHYTWDETGLVDYWTFYLDLKHATDPKSAKWQLAYELSDAYDVARPLSVSSVHEVYKKIVCNKTYTTKFADFYQSFRGVDYTKEDELHWQCSMRYAIYQDYHACMKGTLDPPTVHC
eukprot:TRINITY_DN8495_c0_g1_i2.p1 TRINITY_DN8495_c0_g1~~TRINITY_DN8495_c0_g1_i2.p1  ORF type:complete len:435 (-),score=77.74 TRINITY_DN8495_c0_g1_i2:84-1388(-)